MKSTENNIKISDVISSLKTTNLVSEFGHNCDFLKHSLVLFHNLTMKGIEVSKDEKQEIVNILKKIEQVVKDTVSVS
jgi:hypothetical protein